MNGDSARTEPFPAPSKKTTGTVNGISTEVEFISFADKIMITVSQSGRLAQWVSL
jgi:proteasome assembly chaperone 3